MIKDIPINREAFLRTRGFSGLQIDRSIYFYSELIWAEKILWLEIKALSSTREGCYASNEYFAHFLGVECRSVSRYLSRLKELGLIEQVSTDGRKRQLIPNRRFFAQLEDDMTELSTQISQSCLLNNKSKDKDNNKDHKIKEIDSKESINGTNVPSSKNPTERFQRQAPIVSLSNSISSKKKLRPLGYVQKTTGEYAVLMSWNRLPKPAGQHTKFDTKTVQCAVQCLSQMRSGVFGDLTRRRWNGKWLDRHKIDAKEFAEKKWTFREICRTVEGPLGDMYKEGFWPPDKSSLPRSLADALYNPRTQSSFFVLAFYDPPGLLKIQSVKDPYPNVTKGLVGEGFIQLSQMKIGDWKEYFKGVRGLEGYLKKINWENYGAKQMFGFKGENLCALIMQYAKWVKGDVQDLLSPSKIPDRFHVGMIRQDYWMWPKFMEVVNRYWGQVFLCVSAEEK